MAVWKGMSSTLDGRPILKKRGLLAPEFVAIRMGDSDHAWAFHFAFQRG